MPGAARGSRQSFETDITVNSTADFQAKKGVCCVAGVTAPFAHDRYFSRLLAFWLGKGRWPWCPMYVAHLITLIWSSHCCC